MSQQYIKPDPVNIPPPLRDCPQWGNWDPVTRENKTTKVMKNSRTGRNASSTNPDTWAAFERALKTNPDRIGFVLTSSGFTVIDLDHCRDPDTGIIDEWAWLIIRRLNSYTEISVSGTGIHIIIRGQLPPGRRRVGQIETYDSGRYITMTGAVVDGHGSIRDDDGILAAWHIDTFPQEPEPTSEPFTRMGASLATEEILERAFNADNGGKFREYYEGGLGNKSSRSEARYALIGMTIFWTQDPEKIEDVLRSSGQWNAKVEKRPELVQKEIRDQLHRYRGPIYGEHRPPPKPTPPPVFEPGATCDQRLTIALETIRLKNEELAAARDTIVARERVIEREREMRQAAEERVGRLSFERSELMQIIRNPDLGPGPKLTHFVTVMDLGARIANGEEPARHGFRLPATTIAAKSGQKVSTVRNHLKAAASAGWLTKTNVREPSSREGIDEETGEITSGTQDVTYIDVPDNDITLLIAPVSSFRKDEPENRGGKRTPTCKEHPDAATITTSVTVCADCHAELDRRVIVHEPAPWGTSFAPQNTRVVNTSQLGAKDAPQPQGWRASSSAPKFAPQPPTMPPPDDWAGPPPEAEPTWLWEGAVS